MYFRRSVSIICLIGIVICCSLPAIHARKHDKSPRMGKHVQIGQDVIVEENSKIDDYTKIASHVLIKRDSYVGRHVTINEYCILGKHVDIFDRVTIEPFTTIDDKSEVKTYTKIGRNVTIGRGVSIGKYCTIEKNNTIGSGSTLEKYVKTGPNVTIDRNVRIERNTKISANTYIGKYSSVGLRSTMGESVVIHKNVKLPKAAKIKANEVIVITPSSFELYQICARHVTDDEAKNAIPSEDDKLSPAFNKYLNGLIDAEMKNLTTSCTKTKNQTEIFKLKTLPKIVSLYLIHYHGLERFNTYVREVQESLNVEGSPESETFRSLEEKLQGQCHLVKNSKRKILEDGIRDKFIELLVIDEDAQRSARVLGDTFCKMVKQIQTKERSITFAKNDSCKSKRDK